MTCVKWAPSRGAAVVEILTSQQMRHIDRRAIGRFKVPEIVLMENAGLRVFEVLKRLEGNLATRRCLLRCGRGNNGGDTCVLPRRLRTHGHPFSLPRCGGRPE